MNSTTKILILISAIASCINVHAQNYESDKCLKLLSTGIYNQSLEEVCAFDGGVKDKLKSLYSDLGCRSIIPQEDVNKVSQDVLINIRARYQSIGKEKFCTENKKAYFALANPTENLPRFKNGETYSSVRRKMIQAGWKPYHSPEADVCGNDSRCNGRPEMEACAGTGMANCKFLWQKNSRTIGICTVGEEAVFDNICSNQLYSIPDAQLGIQ